MFFHSAIGNNVGPIVQRLGHQIFDLVTRVRFPLGSPLDRSKTAPARKGPSAHAGGPCASWANICVVFRVAARQRAEKAGNQARPFCPSWPKNRPGFSLFLRKPATTPTWLPAFRLLIGKELRQRLSARFDSRLEYRTGRILRSATRDDWADVVRRASEGNLGMEPEDAILGLRGHQGPAEETRTNS